MSKDNKKQNIIEPKVMEFKHTVHPYQEGLLMFKPVGEPVFHRQVKPSKETFIELRDGKYGNVQSFFIFNSESLEDMIPYRIADIQDFIKTQFPE